MAEGSTGAAVEPPALDYSLPLPQEPSAMQLSCEPVLHRALLYPVNAEVLQQCLTSKTRTHARTHTHTHTITHTFIIFC